MTTCMTSFRHLSPPRSSGYFRTLALAVTAFSSLMLFDAGARAAGSGCRAQCRQECKSACGSGEVACGPCVAEKIELRRTCRETVNGDGFSNCVDKRCTPGVPGRCTLTRQCVDQ